MKYGFVTVAAITPQIKVAWPEYNRRQIEHEMQKAWKKGAQIMVFPELCLCGYTCNDLFLQETLLRECRKQLQCLVKCSEGMEALVFVGLPLEYQGKLYNVAAAFCNGELLAFVPKSCLPSYGEFYETRHFTSGENVEGSVRFEGKEIPFGTKILLQAKEMPELVVACEICEDLWTPLSPGTFHAMAGATVIVNLSASNETIGKSAYRQLLVESTSGKLVAGYIYTSAGEGESTQDLVFGGHNLIAENGTILAQSSKFENASIYTELDIERIMLERRKRNTFSTSHDTSYRIINFDMTEKDGKLIRKFDRMPFVPSDVAEREKRCEEILSIQSFGLKKRYEHTGCQRAVIGVSGGLDSTLALLVVARTFDMLGLPRKNIFAVTMPCFGTTDRTYENACKLAETLGTTLEEVDIKEAVTIHFRDIRQPMEQHDVTYENGQARERTQVLMDIANRENGMVIGTGDMSELALGWATYNGDHMSMYGVNVGVPKTLVRHLVKYYADTCGNQELQKVLFDVLDTPVSPELLPPVDGVISQKTEDLVGPYELHDFFLYYVLRWGFSPSKIYRMALDTFEGSYGKAEILKWLKIFYRRFFQQQFKRSCLPDGPKVGSVAVSPRGDLRMPSDACANLWLSELEEL